MSAAGICTCANRKVQSYEIGIHEMVIEPRFNNARDFSKGLADVEPFGSDK
jgi:hypothetical protein